MSELIAAAKRLAEMAHNGQVRQYSGEPYILHCQQVAEILHGIDAPDYVVAAGWLHDTMEDRGLSDGYIAGYLATVCPQKGRRVAYIVDLLTMDYISSNRRARLETYLRKLERAEPFVQTVKLADICSNVPSIATLDKDFADVYLPEKQSQVNRLLDGDIRLREMANKLIEIENKTLNELKGEA